MTNITTEHRFMRHVSPVSETGCWLWDGAPDGRYGTFSIGSKSISAHKASYLMFKGAVPEGMQVTHSCDVKCCVRPDHLHLGTHRSNVDEAVERQRHRRGERQHLAKLTAEKVKQIRAMLGSHRAIARQFGVHQTTISDIKRGDIWKHVAGES